MKDSFRRFAHACSAALGSSWAFLAAAVFVVGWLVLGPVFGFSEGWQLVASTITNVATFVMVFLIQSTQNRDTLAIRLKLDELLRALHGARTSLVNLETLSDDDLARLEQEFERLRRHVSDARDDEAPRARSRDGVADPGGRVP